MAPLGLPWLDSSSSSDPAQGTREEAERSMRHANSPRRPRRLSLSRRFRHTAFSPPPCTRAMHRANRNARFSHIHEFCVVGDFRIIV
jgi:hypothetical protein